MNLHNTLSTMPVFVLGFGASIAASLGTGAGALPVFALGRVSQRAQDVLQSLAAGIMLAATVISLVIPGVEAGTRQYGSKAAGALIVAAAVVIGALAILMVHRHAPHEHFLAGRAGPAATRLRRTWLFVIAITLHNFPEGMAVGVGFGGGDVANGLALSSAIFIQNLPEGFLVAMGLLVAGYGKPFSVFASFATGLVETAGGLLGAAAVATSVLVLPWAMGFAAGAMLFVISHEIIPETHRNGFETEATFGLVGGFVAMVVLNALLG
jgi:zinc transporter, ZIP family